MATGIIVQEGDLSGLTANGALSKGMLVAFDTTAGQVVPATATLRAIGVVDRDYANGATDVSVLALNKNRVLHMIASAGTEAFGDHLQMAAGGKVESVPTDARVASNATSEIVGMARSAAAAADDLIEVRIL